MVDTADKRFLMSKVKPIPDTTPDTRKAPTDRLPKRSDDERSEIRKLGIPKAIEDYLQTHGGTATITQVSQAVGLTTTHQAQLSVIFGGALRATPKGVIASFPELFELEDDRVTSRTSSKPREEIWAAQLTDVADEMERFLREAGREMDISRFSRDLHLKKGPLWPKIKAVIKKKNEVNIGDLPNL